MRTATEIFNDIRPELSAKDERGRRRPLDIALVEACDRVKGAYLSQRDVDGYEAACAAQIFESCGFWLAWRRSVRRRRARTRVPDPPSSRLRRSPSPSGC